MPTNDDVSYYSYFAAHEAKCKEIESLRAQLAAAVERAEKAERERDEARKPSKHSGCCMWYASITNNDPRDGICTCGYGEYMQYSNQEGAHRKCITEESLERHRNRREASADRDRLAGELRNIADADPRKWDADMRDQFQAWAQNRARAALAQPAPDAIEKGGEA